MTKERTRLHLRVSRETDANVRAYLAACGMKQSDLSRFVEEAILGRLSHDTAQQAPAPA
jgi:Ribbon-helix-helix domain